MTLSMEVGVGPGDTAGTAPPNFRPMSVVAKRLDDLMPLGTGVSLGPGDFAFDGDPSPPENKGTAPTQFWPIYCGQTSLC